MNGYTAIEINGEKVGLKFGMPANRWFAEKLLENIDLISNDGVTNEIGIAYLCYYGYLNNCLVKEESPKFKYEVFYDFVEEAMISPDKREVLETVSKVYADSSSTKEWVKRTEEATEQIKKKMMDQIGTLSNPSATENSDLPMSSTSDAPSENSN